MTCRVLSALRTHFTCNPPEQSLVEGRREDGRMAPAPRRHLRPGAAAYFGRAHHRSHRYHPQSRNQRAAPRPRQPAPTCSPVVPAGGPGGSGCHHRWRQPLQSQWRPREARPSSDCPSHSIDLSVTNASRIHPFPYPQAAYLSEPDESEKASRARADGACACDGGGWKRALRSSWSSSLALRTVEVSTRWRECGSQTIAAKQPLAAH